MEFVICIKNKALLYKLQWLFNVLFPVLNSFLSLRIPIPFLHTKDADRKENNLKRKEICTRQGNHILDVW